MISPVKKISSKAREILAVLAVAALAVIFQGRLWITHEHIATHDSIIWFGIFSYFADSLQHGVFPFWNPYMNCGEPFFLNINIMHLLDPATLLLIFTGKVFNIGLLALYHYDLLSRYLIFIFGAFIFLRHAARLRISAFIAFTALAFSSVYTSYLRQSGFILAFYLLPWILWSALKLWEQRRPKFLFMLVFFSGLTAVSYHAMFSIVSLGLLFLFLLLTRGLPWPKISLNPKKSLILTAAGFIFILLTIQVWPLYQAYSHEVIPTLRLIEAPTAAYSFGADFFNLLTPYSFIVHFFDSNRMSEAFLYIGLLPLLLAAIGIFFGRHRYKWGFILTTAILPFLMLGGRSFVYPFLRQFFPFFSIIRNMTTFGFFFMFCLAFFVCLGSDVIFTPLEKQSSLSKRYFCVFVFLICALGLGLNTHTLNLFPSLISLYHILGGYPELMTMEAARIPVGLFPKSDWNIIFFALGSAVLFLFLKRQNRNHRFIAGLVIVFLLIDLLAFGRTVYRFVTMPRAPAGFSLKQIPLPASDSQKRLRIILPRYPFFAFAPAMHKKFTAYNTEIPWVTTHFYELKSFYEFSNQKKISEETKDAWMGISTPRLRLVPRGMVLTHQDVLRQAQDLDSGTAGGLVFVEEDLPPGYAHLRTSLSGTGEQIPVQGEIEITNFNANEVDARIECSGDGLLYYSDGFDKGWRAFVDGREEKVYQANYAFKSVVLDKGRHRLRFIYDPRFYKMTLFCYFAGLKILLIIFLGWICRKSIGSWRNRRIGLSGRQ